MTTPEQTNDNNYTSAAQVLVLERLTRMETKLDLYNETRRNADVALEMARQNSKDITEIKDDKKWFSRTLIGLVFMAITNFAVNVMQGF